MIDTMQDIRHDIAERRSNAMMARRMHGSAAAAAAAAGAPPPPGVPGHGMPPGHPSRRRNGQAAMEFRDRLADYQGNMRDMVADFNTGRRDALQDLHGV